MKIAFKLEDKVENLRKQLDDKDQLIAKLRKQSTDLEADFTKKQTILQKKFSKEKIRAEEAIFNISLNNSKTIQDLHSQMAKKKNKIVYYEKKVDILKKSFTDLENERKIEKQLIHTLELQNKQQGLENEQLQSSIKAFQDAIQMSNMSKMA